MDDIYLKSKILIQIGKRAAIVEGRTNLILVALKVFCQEEVREIIKHLDVLEILNRAVSVQSSLLGAPQIRMGCIEILRTILLVHSKLLSVVLKKDRVSKQNILKSGIGIGEICGLLELIGPEIEFPLYHRPFPSVCGIHGVNQILENRPILFKDDPGVAYRHLHLCPHGVAVEVGPGLKHLPHGIWKLDES
jgi:hypothetical protein